MNAVLSKHVSYILRGTLILSGMVVIYHLGWGRLAGLLPFMPAFRRLETEKIVIFYHRGTHPQAFLAMQEVLPQVEDFHHLKFKHKPELVLCRTQAEMQRLTGTKTRFVTYPVRGRIFASSKGQDDGLTGTIHLDVYLRHELSHTILYQNMPGIRFRHFPHWLLEGVATYSACQRGVDGYLSREETIAYLQKGYFLDPRDWEQRAFSAGKNSKVMLMPNRIWFIYSEFATIVEDLVKDFGEEQFIAYLHRLLTGDDHDLVFREIFQTNFEIFLERYRKYRSLKTTQSAFDHGQEHLEFG